MERPFGRGPTTRSLGDLSTMVINHCELTGMIQVVFQNPSEFLGFGDVAFAKPSMDFFKGQWGVPVTYVYYHGIYGVLQGFLGITYP